MPEPTPDQLHASEEKLAALRARLAAGPTDLAEAARVLDIKEPTLMAMISLHELQRVPGGAAVVACLDGPAFIRLAGNDVTITCPPTLAAILIEGMLSDPKATIAIAAPLAVATSQGKH
jgi:hypothetical protein